MSRGLVPVLGALTLALGLPISGSAAEPQTQDFDAETFARAQADGRVILVESFAGWCLICRIQSPSLEQVLKKPRYSSALLFRLREHSPKAAWKQFRLKSYGAMIVYHGQNETARQMAPKTAAAIEALLATAYDSPQYQAQHTN